ncbi:glycerophosphodiester phosphodiesterase [Arthrobacter celericrescens]|uniref:glycerophosphodiester phosphodiesterase n=1 Tax=Arthrobacter celericrescens TaxID=2320851 RepID=UPI000EA34644|nr:glycerophosphodiester phosphodiesterase family protein [Arthrobacter celericrescens]
MKASAAAFGRRGFLALAVQGAFAAGSALVAGTALSGCRGCPQPGATATSVPTLAPVSDVPLQPGGPYTIKDLLSTKTFYIAHRGSGDNWPEHTMRAYSESVALGLKAIEVSVWASSDGVLLCHHDAGTLRTSGQDLQIPATPYAELAKLRVDARAWLGPATPLEPMPRLRDVLNAYARSHVIFLEDKGGTNADAIFTMLQDYPDSRQHIVWKQPAMSPGHLYARQWGYTTWGYFTSKELDRAADFQDRVDLLGVPTLGTEAQIRQLVATGKPVIGWEVHRRWERDRLQRLGVRGMMCSNVPYVLQRVAPATSDTLGEGTRPAGDLPWNADSDWTEQPAFVDDALRFAAAAGSYTVGSMAPLAAPGWRLDVELRWPEGTSGARRAGIAFALGDDSPVAPPSDGAGQAATQGGYRLDIAADGSLDLGRADKGRGRPAPLASAAGGGIGDGRWFRVRVEMAPVGVRASASADGGRTWSAQSNDTAFRGGYFALLAGNASSVVDGGAPVEFRKIAVTALSQQEMCLT